MARGRPANPIRLEEYATLWLWAWPQLLGWKARINWLFSPVTGNRQYPGDLWGIDADGVLIVLETKRRASSRSSNPFEDFFPWAERISQGEPSDAALRTRFERLYEQELEFKRESATFFSSQSLPGGCFPGVLPYSRHRQVIWEWRELYASRIASHVPSDSYQRAVERSFWIRARQANPRTAVFGVMVTADLAAPWSQAAERDRIILAKRLGTPYVRAVNLRGSWQPRRLRIDVADAAMPLPGHR